MPDQLTVSVPATSANLGPGFDCLGVALSLRNETTFTRTEAELKFDISGIDAHKIPADESNLVYKAACFLFHRLGERPFPMHIQQHNNIPVGSGLGSSSTAILAGLVGANGLLDFPLSRNEVLDLAIEIETHPDNVAPAMHGGLVLSVMHEGGNHIECIDITPIPAVVVLPTFQMLTEEARALLPTTISRQDAIFNTSRLALLIRAFQTGNHTLFKLSMQDKLHQPYRLSLIPGAETAVSTAYASGACGVALSGAGPSLIALATENQAEIAQAMIAAFHNAGLETRHWHLLPDTDGIMVTEESAMG